MRMLLEQETYSCGTTRANRKNWPTEFRKPTVLKLKRGGSRKMQHEDVLAVVWQEKRVVLLLSTNSDPQTDGSVTQKTGKGNEETEIACPQAVINYTKHMGGMDVSDQRRKYSGVGRSSKKWWKFILHFVLNVCLVKCFILYDIKNHPPLQHRETSIWPSDETWFISWLVHSRLTSVQAGREIRLSEPFPCFTKSIRPCKSVCFVYRKKEKSSIWKG